MEDFGALVGCVMGVVSASAEGAARGRIGPADTTEGVSREI